MSLIWIRVGSDLAPAPIEEKTLIYIKRCRKPRSNEHLDVIIVAILEKIDLGTYIVDSIFEHQIR